MKTIQFLVDNNDSFPQVNFFNIGHAYFKLQGPGLPEVQAGQTPSGFYGFYGNGIHDDGTRYQAGITSPNIDIVASSTYNLSDSQYDTIIQFLTLKITSPDTYNVRSYNCVDFSNTIYQFYNPNGGLGNVFTAEQMRDLENSGAAIYLGEKFIGLKYVIAEWADVASSAQTTITEITAHIENFWVTGRSFTDNGVNATFISDDATRRDTLVINKPSIGLKTYAVIPPQGQGIIMLNDVPTIIMGSSSEEQTLSYAGVSEGVDVDLGVGNTYLQSQIVDGLPTGQPKDIFVNIENVVGSSHNDRLVASRNTTFLEGGPGDDELEDPYPDHATEYRFNQGFGRDIVSDDDRQGTLVYEGQKVEGTLAIARNSAAVFYLDAGKHTAVFTRVTITGNNNGTVDIQGTDAVMTVNRAFDKQTKDAASIVGFDPLISSFGIKVSTTSICQYLVLGNNNKDLCYLMKNFNGDEVINHTIHPLDTVYTNSFKAPSYTFVYAFGTPGNTLAYVSNLNVQFYLGNDNDTAICGVLQPNYEIAPINGHVIYNRQCIAETGEGHDIVKITYNTYHPYSFDFIVLNDFDTSHDRVDLTEYTNIHSFSDVKPYNNAGFEGTTFLLEDRTILRFPNLPTFRIQNFHFILGNSGFSVPAFPDRVLGDNTDETIAATKPGSYYNGLGGKDTMVAEISQKGAPTTVRGGADDDRFTVVGSPSGLARRDTLEASQSQQSLPTDKDRALRAAFYAEEPREYTAQPSSLWSRATSYVTSSWNSFWDEVEEEMEYDREVETDGVWLDGSEDFPERKQAKLAERAVTERDANAQELILSDFNPELTNSTETGELTASETITLEGYTSYFGNNVGNVPVVARDNGTELQIPGYNVFLPYVAPGQFNASLHLQLTDGAGAGDGDGSSNAGVIAGAVVGTVVPLTGMLVLAAVGGALAYRYREPIKNAAGTSASWVLERYHTVMGHEAAVIAAPAPDLNDAIEMQNVAGDDGSKQDEERGEERGEEDNLGATPPATVVPFPYMGSGPAAPTYRHVHPRKPLPPVPGTPVVDSKEKEKEKEKEGNPTENQENENGSGMWQRAGTKSAIMRSYQSREHDDIPASFVSRLRPTVPSRTPAPEGEKEYAGDSSIYEGNPLPEERNDGAEEMTYGHQQGGTVLPFVPASSTLRNQSLRVRDVVTTFLKSKYATNAVYKDPAARQKILDLLQKNVLKTEKSTVVLSMSQVGNGEGQITEEVIVQAILTYAVSALLQKSGRTMEEARESPEFREAIANVHKDIQNAVHDVITSPEKQQDLAA